VCNNTLKLGDDLLNACHTHAQRVLPLPFGGELYSLRGGVVKGRGIKNLRYICVMGVARVDCNSTSSPWVCWSPIPLPFQAY